MRTITTNIYKFDELSEEAKEKAIEEYRNDMPLAWQEEMKKTVRVIARAVNCNAEWYSRDGITYDVSFYTYEYINLCGKRAWAFIENNFITPNEKPKIYRKKYYLCGEHNKNRKRKSKINYTLDDCPFTGYTADCCFVKAWREWKKNFNEHSSVEEFITLVTKKLSEEWTNNNKYQISDEAIIDIIEANDYEFLEDGTFYYSKERG